MKMPRSPEEQKHWDDSILTSESKRLIDAEMEANWEKALATFDKHYTPQSKVLFWIADRLQQVKRFLETRIGK